MSEPGLILTPPQQGSDADDGYLTAGETAGLKLDADWVILSACNTAAAGSTNAEALSALGSCFLLCRKPICSVAAGVLSKPASRLSRLMLFVQHSNARGRFAMLRVNEITPDVRLLAVTSHR